MNLHNAVESGNLKRVKIIVEQGANMDKIDSGITPLYLASLKGRVDIVQYLVEQGASLDKASSGGYTPLTE
jgi:ankyrin repeat protein